MYTLVICVDPDQTNKPCRCVNYNQIRKLNLVDSIGPGQPGESVGSVDPDQNANINILT